MTELHSVVDVDVDEKDVACRTHEGELVRFYCEPCAACICVVCAFQQPHHDHDVASFSEAVGRHRHALDGLLVRCRGRARLLRSQLELTARWAVEVRTAEQQVRDAVCSNSIGLAAGAFDLRLNGREFETRRPLALPGSDLGQVTHAYVPLPPSSITCYRCKSRGGNGRLWSTL